MKGVVLASLIRFVQDRRGHDCRYRVDCSRVRLEWAASISFEEGLQATVDWCQKNEESWRKIKNETFRDYYDQVSGCRPNR